MPITPEDRIQIDFINWLDKQPYILTRFHVANERATSARPGAYLKKKGVLAGVWDVWVITNKPELLVIEFKYGNNVLSEKQKEFEKILEVLKIPHKVCYSAFEASTFVRERMGVKNNDK